MNNSFLYVENHDASCFCRICREQKLRIMDDRIHTLQAEIKHRLPFEREKRLNAVFSVTKKMILSGKKYKDTCLNIANNPRMFTQFRSWANTQPMYFRYIHGTDKLKKKFSDHCKFVNDAATCAENWEKIVANLTDERITNIKAKTLDVHQLARATSMNWCIYYNSKCGRTSNVPDADEPGTYSMEDANNIRDLIVQNGVLTRIEHNPVVASSLMKSVTLKVIKHCRDISE